MALFESLLALLFVSILLLKLSGHIGAPYPTMLAFAGACVAALPWAPEIDIQPRLALALFIAPALLDSAYDLPPRELRRDWLPLTWLAVIAVVLTTAAVAWVGWAWAGHAARGSDRARCDRCTTRCGSGRGRADDIPAPAPHDGHPSGRKPSERCDRASHLYRCCRDRHAAGNIGPRHDSGVARRCARRRRTRSRALPSCTFC